MREDLGRPLSRRCFLGVTLAGAGAWLCGCASAPVAEVGGAEGAEAGIDAAAHAAAADVPAAAPPLPDLFDASLVDEDFWRQPRTIDVLRPQTGERMTVRYWADGRLLERPYRQLCHLMRDVHANRSTRMDPTVIDTMWASQAFLARYGITAPVELLSGYRTPATNRRRGGVRGSLHTQGRAVDYRIRAVHPQVLGKLVRGFENGGVGLYHRDSSPGGGWIHADSGAVRTWRG